MRKIKKIIVIFESDDSASLEDQVEVDFSGKRVVIERAGYKSVERKPDQMPRLASAHVMATDYLYRACEGRL